MTSVKSREYTLPGSQSYGVVHSVWATYVDGQRKLTRKSEAAVESDRVLKFVFDKEYRVINSSVQASMRNTSYKVQVSALHMYPPRSCHFAVQMFVSSLNFISVINEPYQRHMIRHFFLL